MNEDKLRENLDKYVTTGADAILQKNENPYREMKSDSFMLEVQPGFSGKGGSIIWTNIYKPVKMQPEAVVSEQSRYISIFGGVATDFSKLYGEVEVTLGKDENDLQKYSFSESLCIYVKKGMMYSINIMKVDDPSCPIHYNELVLGDAPLVTDKFSGNDAASYDVYIKTGSRIYGNYPDKEHVTSPVMLLDNTMFESNEIIHRTWVPITTPYIMAKAAHTHECPEILAVYGSDPDNISDLGGVVEFSIGETPETLVKYVVDKATAFSAPGGLWHCPLVFRKVNDPSKPIIFSEISYAEGLVQDRKHSDTIVDDELLPESGDY